MPELPEVETLKRELEPKLKNRQIVEVEVLADKIVAPLTPAGFRRKIKGRVIKGVSRIAKMLVIDFKDGSALVIHLKMTGQLIFVPTRGRAVTGGHPQKGGGDNFPNRYTRLNFVLDNGNKLYFNDLRKFGWARLKNETAIKQLRGQASLDPLDPEFSLVHFSKTVGRYPNRSIKAILLDQQLIAGIGNIYADEACFNSGIRPERKGHSLTKSEIKKLYTQIIVVLKLSIEKKGTFFSDYLTSSGTPGGFLFYLQVYGRKGAPCQRCQTPIEKIKLAGRGTHFCPRCQK